MQETILDRLAKRAPKKNPGQDADLDREISKYLSRIRAQVSKRKYIKSGRGGFSSMGARGVFVKENSIYHRRVIVKASYIPSSSKNTRERICHHLNYAGQEKLDEQKNAPELYGADEQAINIKYKIKDFEEAPRVFNLIISPEDGNKLDLKDFTRDFINNIEIDLKTKLDWVAGNHYDTNDPHVHLLINGVDDTGKHLLIKPDYIANGFRARASQVVTNKLGLRNYDDVVKSIELKVSNTKRCELDDIIVKNSSEGHLNLDKLDEDALNDLPRSLFDKRLQYLESRELCKRVNNYSWQVKPDLHESLKNIDRTSSLITKVADSLSVDKQSCEIISAKNLSERVIKGHVVERGYVDDHGDKQYLLIKSKEKKHVYVELEKYSEKSPAQVGEFVKVETTKAFSGPKISDQTIFQHSAEQKRIYDAKTHEISISGSKKLPPGVSAKDYVQVHINRLEVLARIGLVKKLSTGQFEIPKDYLDKIKQETKKSQEKFTAHIKVIRLSPARLKTKSIQRGIRR